MALKLPLAAFGGRVTIPEAYVVAGVQSGFDNGKLTGRPALSVSLSAFYDAAARHALADALAAVTTAEAAAQAATAIRDAKDAAFQRASQGGFTPERAAALAEKRVAQAELDNAIRAIDAARADVQAAQPIRGLLADVVQVPVDAIAGVLTEGRPDIAKVYAWLATLPTFAGAENR